MGLNVLGAAVGYPPCKLMNASPAPEAIAAFYDANVGRKLRGFVEGNPRVERAWLTIDQWAPPAPRRILEVGCGIGDICWRMSRRWPEAIVLGLDLSQKSLEIARHLFESPRVSFVKGPLTKESVAAQFDLILLMDLYEHITVEDRAVLHEALRDLQGPGCRVILSFPTPRHQAWLRKHHAEQIQPVDEDIRIETISALARDVESKILLYQEVGVWHQGDYAHAVLGRIEDWVPANGRPPRRGIEGRIREILARKPEPLVPPRSQRLALVQQRLDQHYYHVQSP